MEFRLRVYGVGLGIQVQGLEFRVWSLGWGIEGVPFPANTNVPEARTGRSREKCLSKCLGHKAEGISWPL